MQCKRELKMLPLHGLMEDHIQEYNTVLNAPREGWEALVALECLSWFVQYNTKSPIIISIFLPIPFETYVNIES